MTAQVLVFWHPTLLVAAPVLGTFLLTHLAADFARTLLLRRHVVLPDPRILRLVVGAGWMTGAAAVLGLSWLAYPAGAVIDAERTNLEVSILAAATSGYGWLRVAQISAGALAVGSAFFMLGAARRREPSSLSLTTLVLVVTLTLHAALSAAHVRAVGQYEPVKLAAMTALWKTRPAAPLELGAWPFDFVEKSKPGIRYKGVLSTWVHGQRQAQVEGLLATPMENRPPVLAMYGLFQSNLALSALAWLTAMVGWRAPKTGTLSRWWPALVVTPLVTLLWLTGWLMSELGRSPWTIRGALRVGDAVWLPYGMAPTALFWVGGSLLAVIMAARQSRRVAPVAPPSPILSADAD